LPARSVGAKQDRSDIMTDVDDRLAALGRIADDVYRRWTRGLVRYESRA